ncbi:hypothetical protein [Labrys miyagiensis]
MKYDRYVKIIDRFMKIIFAIRDDCCCPATQKFEMERQINTVSWLRRISGTNSAFRLPSDVCVIDRQSNQSSFAWAHILPAGAAGGRKPSSHGLPDPGDVPQAS